MAGTLRRVEFAHELAHPTPDLVASAANRVERLALRVRQVPVQVLLARYVGALVAAAHRHHDVGTPSEFVRQALGLTVGEVDAELAHDLDHLRMHPVAGRCARGCCGMAPGRGLIEQRLAHLRPAGVVEADEEDVHRHSARTNWYAKAPTPAPRSGLTTQIQK